MAEMKLTYFDMKGRAELVRLVFAAAGKKFEDIRYKQGEWDTAKDKTPFGQSPTLEVNGKVYGQSLAIATYVARETGLYGKTNLDGLAIDMYVQLCYDFINFAVKAIREKDEAKKAEIWKAFQEEESPKYFAWFEKALTDNGSGYLVGKQLTLADIAVYEVITGMLKDRLCSVDKFPKLKAHTERVGQNPGIKAWMAKRS